MLVKINVGRLINPYASGLLPISSLGQEETSHTLSWHNAIRIDVSFCSSSGWDRVNFLNNSYGTVFGFVLKIILIIQR